MWRYSEFLPDIPGKSRIQLGEGDTPMIRSRKIGEMLGVPGLYFKLESTNPSGSYKDRFASVLVSHLYDKKQRICISTSSGNTGAALAAYCAAAGIRCILAIVDGAPLAKIKQMQLYGAHTYMVKGFGKDVAITNRVFELLGGYAKKLHLPFPISAFKYCEEGMLGVQTIAYEILDDPGFQIDHIFSPAGGGGLTLAVAKGCLAYKEKYPSAILPKVHCVQPEGNNTIAGALRDHKTAANPVKECTTVISGLQVPGVLDGDAVIHTCKRLGGTGYVVVDEAVFQWQKALAMYEGIFCEPAGAVALAGFADAVARKEVRADDHAICLVTGSGFKDMQSVEKHFGLQDVSRIEYSEMGSIIDPFDC